MCMGTIEERMMALQVRLVPT
eukprot:COSAG05_NODE_14495_length_395_cov_0.746622_2_plen_20_part_01